MSEADGVRDAIISIYQSAVEPSHWPRTLELMSQIGGGIRTYVSPPDRRVGVIVPGASHGFDPTYLESYHRHYGALDPWADRARAISQPIEVVCHSALPRSQLAGTSFYEEWLRPQGDHTAGGEIVAVTGGGRAIVLGGDIPFRQAELLEDRWLRFLRLLAPALAKAIKIGQEQTDILLENNALAVGDNPHGAAILLVGEGGVILRANRIALNWLEAGDLLQVAPGGRLRLPEGDACERMAAALQSFRGGHPAPVSLTLRLHGAPAAAAHLLPVAEDALLSGSLPWRTDEPPVAVFLARRAIDNDGSAAELCRTLGLTPAEARVALALANGRTLAEIAESRGVSIHTVRNQSKSAIAKSGVRRQAQLVRLVADVLRARGSH